MKRYASPRGASPRARFALLVAGAIVFAPAWHGRGPQPDAPGADLAARVLAPTVDEGALRDATANVRRHLNARFATRSRAGVSFESVTPVSVAAVALLIFWAVVLHPGSPFALYRLRFRFSRAPPRLRPAP